MALVYCPRCGAKSFSRRQVYRYKHIEPFTIVRLIRKCSCDFHDGSTNIAPDEYASGWGTNLEVQRIRYLLPRLIKDLNLLKLRYLIDGLDVDKLNIIIYALTKTKTDLELSRKGSHS